MFRAFSLGVALVALSACAQDPFAERLEHPRMNARGWIAIAELGVEQIDPAERALMTTYAETSDRELVKSCTGARSATWVRAEAIAPSDDALAELAGADGLVTRHRVSVEACGATRLHALYLAPREGRIVTGTPGGSIASLGLQREVLRIMAPQAAGIISSSFEEGECDAMAYAPWVLDTALVYPPEDGAWREIWTVGACGQTREVEVSFEETEDGATFRAPIFLD
ncbi:MAG: hypothetical protein PVI23_02120 [Maricaulaceae bacterium]